MARKCACCTCLAFCDQRTAGGASTGIRPFCHSGHKLTESAGPFWVRRVYQTLRELGDVEGENLIVERFSADGRSERFASLAAEVVGRKPDVIILNFIELAKVFMVTTSTIPLVAIIGDPIAAGLPLASLIPAAI